MPRKLKLPPNEALYPVPVVLVSCVDKTCRKANIITIAWCGVACSSPPVISVAIRPSRYSHAIISRTKDFAVNIPARGLLRKVDLCGVISGRNADKFKEASLTRIDSSVISSPMIGECPVNIECRLKDIIRLGSHDLFLGEVVAVHADESVLDDNGNIDFAKAAPLVYNQGEYWDLGAKVGAYGCSR